MTSKLIARRDIDFLLYEWLKAEELCARPAFADHSRETFDATIELSQQMAEEVFYPLARPLDTQEPTFDGETVRTPDILKPAINAYREAGFLSARFSPEQGGMGLPLSVVSASQAYFQASAAAPLANIGLTPANASTQFLHGTEEQKRLYLGPMLEGRFSGTMCLSEPQAGSGLADIRTRAVKQKDGTYRLFGNKMWISGGDHDLTDNIIHLVLAKIVQEDGSLIPGTRGISLFTVPKIIVNPDGSLGERNDVAVAGLNHKLGWRAATNCLINFGEGRYKVGGEAGAVGMLVGKEHQGLACMFHMMNDARIFIGLGAACLAYTAYLHALDYAKTRLQGRHPGDKDPSKPPVRIIEHADVKRMLLAQKAYCEGSLALVLYCARLVDDQHSAETEEERKEAELLLELLTPVTKSWPSQWGQEGNSLAIQVHGGYGYTRDFMVELYYRDQRLNPIHEGTHGIQGLDLLGRKVTMDKGAALTLFARRVEETVKKAKATHGEWALASSRLESAFGRATHTIKTLYGSGDLNKTLANASIFLEAFGHTVLAWIWLEQALLAHEKIGAATGAERDFYAGKLQAARFFFAYELPKVHPMYDLLDSVDTTTLEMEEAWF